MVRDSVEEGGGVPPAPVTPAKRTIKKKTSKQLTTAILILFTATKILSINTTRAKQQCR